MAAPRNPNNVLDASFLIDLRVMDGFDALDPVLRIGHVWLAMYGNFETGVGSSKEAQSKSANGQSGSVGV